MADDGGGGRGGPSPHRSNFARDVLVNVVANLIAAAIVYLLGVFIGLIPRDGRGILAAGAVIAFSAVLGIGLIDRSMRLAGALFALYSFGMAAGCFYLASSSSLHPLVRVLAGVFAVGLAGVGLICVVGATYPQQKQKHH